MKAMAGFGMNCINTTIIRNPLTILFTMGNVHVAVIGRT